MERNSKPAIVIIGKSGAGMSTFGNRLYNFSTGDTKELFEVGHSLNSVTKKPTSKIIELNGKEYDLIDMPGFFEESGKYKQAVESIKQIIIDKHPSGIHAILLVIEGGKMSPKLYEEVDRFMKYFGHIFISNTILVISKVNKNQTINRNLLEEALKVDVPEDRLKPLVDKLENRWVISPNPDIFDSPDDQNWRREADKLMVMIQSIKKIYTMDDLKFQEMKDAVLKGAQGAGVAIATVAAVAILL